MVNMMIASVAGVGAPILLSAFGYPISTSFISLIILSLESLEYYFILFYFIFK